MSDLKITKSVPHTSLEKIYDHRVIDWIEDGMNLNHQRQIHREKYRAKICINCSSQQQEKRGCIFVDIKSNKRSCGHMERAVFQKFLKKSKKHTASHPYNQRLKNLP